ncbi:MAG TPA: HDOD domain-containing protein [Terracidiphilus sp.]|nr:HDOD domain-containing protein [Terracidiphilus sp.]
MMHKEATKSMTESATRYTPVSAARIPILDGMNRVHAYRLHFWEEHWAACGVSAQAENIASRASRVEIEIIARGLPAFVKCPASAIDGDSLCEDWLRFLPAVNTVLELEAGDLETASTALLSNVHRSGYRVAVKGVPSEDSSCWPLMDYIMVDAERMSSSARIGLTALARKNRIHLIAVNVETQREFRERSEQGFDFFQGNYLLHPDPLPVHKIPPNRMVHLEILEELQKDHSDLDHLSQLIKCDAALTYRLLRLVNSPLCATRQEVTSIKSALLLLGENTARRFATMALAAEFNGDQPSEILRISMERARFCELAAGLCGQSSAEQYLIGLVSMFPAMLRISMDDLVKTLPLRDRMRSVLLGQQCPESLLLDWITCHEQGYWDQCDMILQSSGIGREQMLERHSEAIAWADLVLFNAG